MNGADQFYIFLVCAACGIFSGVLYDIIFCAVYPFRKRWVKISADIFFSVLFTALYIFVSLLFSFPAFRFYMFLGFLFGLYLYLKSFHKIVAFLIKMLYNNLHTKKRDKRHGTKDAKPRTQSG